MINLGDRFTLLHDQATDQSQQYFENLITLLRGILVDG
jgi:hypothetical protein